MAVATSKAVRLGCDLARGAIALVAEISSASPSHATALVEAEYEAPSPNWWTAGSTRFFRRGGDDAPERTLQAAGRIANRLRKHGVAAVSSFYPDPGELHRAIKEAELVLDVVTREPEIAEALEEGIAASGVYRLLFRALISDPDELSFYRDTVEPLVRYDNQYRSVPRHARGIPGARLQHAERDGAGDLRTPPHGGLPARAGEGADGPRPADLRGPGAARPRHQGVPDPGAGPAQVARVRQGQER